MKKIISILVTTLVSVSLVATFAACGEPATKEGSRVSKEVNGIDLPLDDFDDETALTDESGNVISPTDVNGNPIVTEAGGNNTSTTTAGGNNTKTSKANNPTGSGEKSTTEEPTGSGEKETTVDPITLPYKGSEIKLPTITFSPVN